MAASDDSNLFLQATFSVNNQDILNDDALHFKLTGSVLKITSFEFTDSTFINSKTARLALTAKCELQ